MLALSSLLLNQQMSPGTFVLLALKKRKCCGKEILRETCMFSAFPARVTFVTFSEGGQKLQMNSQLPEGVSKPTLTLTQLDTIQKLGETNTKSLQGFNLLQTLKYC